MESKIDLSQVTPVNYKVTVVLVNQFAVTTIQFLNRFSAQCEEKLRIVRDGIYRINTGLELLEAKLDSIPSLNSEQDTSSKQSVSMQSAQATSAASDLVLQAPPQQTADAPSTHQTTANELQSELPAAPQQPCAEPDHGNEHTDFVKLKDDLRFSKYFKMVKMGVPPGAVKGKMAMEGVDPDVLDRDPESPAPEGAVTSLPEENSDDSD